MLILCPFSSNRIPCWSPLNLKCGLTIRAMLFQLSTVSYLWGILVANAIAKHGSFSIAACPAIFHVNYSFSCLPISPTFKIKSFSFTLSTEKEETWWRWSGPVQISPSPFMSTLYERAVLWICQRLQLMSGGRIRTIPLTQERNEAWTDQMAILFWKHNVTSVLYVLYFVIFIL